MIYMSYSNSTVSITLKIGKYIEIIMKTISISNKFKF